MFPQMKSLTHQAAISFESNIQTPTVMKGPSRSQSMPVRGLVVGWERYWGKVKFTTFTKSHNAARALCLRYQNVKMANFPCLLWRKKHCCVPFRPSYSCKAPTTYCFDFDGIWYTRKNAQVATDLQTICNKSC